MAAIARRFLGALEPPVSLLWFAPELFEESAAIGAEGIDGYFVTRAAPMGRVAPSVAAAAFYNWNPELLERALRWDEIAPEDALAARERAIRRIYQRVLLGDGGEIARLDRLVELLRTAAAACRPEGRALFAANAALPWPDDDLVALWHGANLLREYRGDGHIAALVAHRVDAAEALVLQAPWVEVKPDAYYRLRAWPDEVYVAAHEALVERGFMSRDGSLTDAGRKFREMIEIETDRLAAPPYDALGPERCEELLALLAPLAERIVQSKSVPGVVGRIARNT